jgi:hypothetical protein
VQKATPVPKDDDEATGEITMEMSPNPAFGASSSSDSSMAL